MEKVLRCNNPGIIALAVVFLMLPGAGWAGAASEQTPSDRQARGGDVEPNNDEAQSSSIAIGETVDGSLLMSPANDDRDYYKINESIPPGKVVCPTLNLVDYYPADPHRIAFHLSVWISYPSGHYTLADLTGFNQTKRICFLQNWDTEPESLKFFICVYKNQTTEPGRYQLSLSILDAPELSKGQATGYVDSLVGPDRAYYKLTGMSDNKGMRFRLQSPAFDSHDEQLYLDVSNRWPITNQWWIQNCSILNDTIRTAEARVVGCGGTYYATIVATGQGTYTFTAEDYGSPLDNNNLPSDAVFVQKPAIYREFLAAGLDPVDWWKVNMTKDIPLPSVSFTIAENEYSGYCEIWVVDKDLKYITGAFCWDDSRSASFPSLTTSYTGPLYFAVGAKVNNMNNFNSRGYYNISFMFPNYPPKLNSGLPAIIMDEDTSDSSLVLSDHVYDPEGDRLNYTVIGYKYNTTPVVELQTGRVNFTPKKDWWGSEVVRFRVMDDSIYKNVLVVNTTVTVNPVNDPPVINSTVSDVALMEEQAWQTPDLATFFTDIDDGPSNLTFGCRGVSSDTTPPGCRLPIKYDARSRTFTLGPAHLFFGTFVMELNCTDGHPGTVPLSMRFSVTASHVNHDPTLKENVTDPVLISVTERGNNSDLLLDDLFTDPDIPKDYADDKLTYSVSGMKKLNAAINPERRLIVNTGSEQYRPGFAEFETLTLVAKDRAGLTATLNVTVTIVPIDDPPVIASCQPPGGSVTMKECDSKAFSITATDVDTEGRFLAYSWYVDGVKDAKAKGLSFTFETDYAMNGTHIIRAEVSDGTTNISQEWNVVVKDVNRLPQGSITSPLNFSKFVRGTPVTFAAVASDPDGDNLTFVWRDLAGNEWGRGANFTTKRLPKGSQTIRLEMNDTKGSTFVDVTIRIEEQAQKKSPGFGAGPFLAALCLAAALGALMRRKRPGR